MNGNETETRTWRKVDTVLRELTLIVLGMEFILVCLHISRVVPTLSLSLSAVQIVVFGLASFRLGRAVAYNAIFEWLRMPFTITQDDSSGAGQSTNSSREKGGIISAVGDLLTCPICSGTWGAVNLMLVYAHWPAFGSIVIYALAFAGIAEIANWFCESHEWSGRNHREMAGSQWMSKDRIRKIEMMAASRSKAATDELFSTMVGRAVSDMHSSMESVYSSPNEDQENPN